MQSIKIYNSLSREKENFQPLKPDIVTMYACGITPQNTAHLGNGTSAVRFAMIRRYLEFAGYQVTFVENVTDIDDKLIQKSIELGLPVREIAEKNYTEYRNSLTTLGVTEPTFVPKVSQYIPKIIQYVQDLIEGGYGYAARGDVYFDVSKKADYYKLSRRKSEENLSGTRVLLETNKRNEADFALWKGDTGNESWDSPWGTGRPGWHIECSTMANDLLGNQIDIHCGGLDLLFPHHENEIAQCEAHNHQTFANIWVHGGMLNINGEKMSKSLNNFISLPDGIAQYGPELLSFAILKHHYRSTIDFNKKLFADILNTVLDFYQSFSDFGLLQASLVVEKSDMDGELTNSFTELMNNDFNTPEAFALIIKAHSQFLLLSVEEKQKNLNTLKTIYALGKVLGVFISTNFAEVVGQLLHFQSFNFNLDHELEPAEIKEKLNLIGTAREAKNYELADKTRGELLSAGINVKYGKGGNSWEFLSAVQN